MNRKVVEGLCCIAALSATQVATAGAEKKNGRNQTDKPNIIYILADDMGYGDISIFGQKKFSTPNLDRLANEGMVFTNHYCGGPVSSASRCCLMTGQHLGHAKVRGNKSLPGVGVMPLDPDIPTIPEAIKLNTDYVTGMSGRWHLGGELSDQTPYHRGFDYHFGKLSSNYGNGYGVMIDPLWTEDGTHRPYEEYSKMHIEPMYENGRLYNLSEKELRESRPVNMDAMITDKAIEFVADNKDNNFFLYVAYALPHSPMEFHEATPPTGYMNEAWPETERAFASMVQALDSYVGKIMNGVDSLGIKEKTIIIFSSDNGPHNEGGHSVNFFKSNGQFSGYKRDLYDGGCHAPMIVRWPGHIEGGSKSDLLSAQWDIMPTVCELAGAPIPEHTDGISFAPTLRGKRQAKKHDVLYWEFSEHPAKKCMWPRQSVVFDNWKVIRYIEEDRYEVFDLSTDVAEGYDLSARRPDLIKKAKAIMDREHVYNEYYPIFEEEGFKQVANPSEIKPVNWEIEALMHLPMSGIRKPGTDISAYVGHVIDIKYRNKTRLGHPYTVISSEVNPAGCTISYDTNDEGNIFVFTLKDAGKKIQSNDDCAGFFFRNVPGIEKGVSMHRYEPYNVWTKPVQFSNMKEFPAKEVHMAYWKYNDGVYAVAVPVNTNGFRTTLGTYNGNFGALSGGCPAGKNIGECTSLVIGFGDNVYDLIKKVYEKAMSIMGCEENSVENKVLPEEYDYLGWCSWNAIGAGDKHTADNIIENLKSFNNEVKLGYAIIDDGWHNVDNRALVNMEVNEEKYPGGLKVFTDRLKKETGIKTVGTWHALNAYWNGIATYGPIWDKYKDEMFSWNQKYTPKSKKEVTCHYFKPGSEAMYKFWDEWISYLSESGISMVKVDNQGCTVRMCRDTYPADELSVSMHDAVEKAVNEHMGGRLINCMALNPDAYYHFGKTPVVRCSEDYFPYKANETYDLAHGNAAAHITQCLYNNLYISRMAYTDMDMFQTYNPNGEMHAISRVMNNGPVYITDETGKQNFDILKKMTLGDGRLVRASSPLYPCEGSLFQVQDKEVFKAYSFSGNTGLVAAFNMADCDNVSGSVTANDVYGIKGEDFIIYEYFSKKLYRVGRDEAIPVSLGRMGYNLFYVMPYDGFAAAGIIDKYIAPATISKIDRSDNVITVFLKEGGDFICFSDKKPSKLTVNGRKCNFNYSESGEISAKIVSKSACEVKIFF